MKYILKNNQLAEFSSELKLSGPIKKYQLKDQKFLIIDSFDNKIYVSDNEHNVDSTNVNIAKLKRNYLKGLKEIKAKNPIRFVICPTYSCNLACSYCYQKTANDLYKGKISDENLEKIFNWILNKVQNLNKDFVAKNDVVIELFGGEPLQKSNYEIVKKIFEFARRNGFYVGATTNGVDIDRFFKLFVIYRGYIARICTTIDGSQEYHDKRRISRKKESTFQKIINNVNALISIKIPVQVAINFDQANIDQFPAFIEMCNKNGWSNNRLVQLEIGRVDDRLFELQQQNIFSESRLLKKIIDFSKSIRLPSNIKFAFLKTSLNIAQEIDCAFNQNEAGRARYHYCWATSPEHHVYYIDSQLKTFRCTYTVGRSKYSTGEIYSSDKSREWFGHNLFNNKKCLECPIGGYCGGGCFLSHGVNAERQCEYELENFDYMVNKVLIPHIEQLIQ